MKRFFTQIYFSCTDFSFYKSIVRQKVSASVQYFLILLFLITLFSSIVYCFYFKVGVKLFAEWSEKNLPEIMIREGIVQSKVSQPYISEQKDFVFILDTTGKVTRIESQYPNGVLLQKSALLVKRAGMEDQEFDLSWIKKLDLSAPIVAAWKEKIMPLLIPVVFLLTLIGLLISKFFQAALFSYCASLFYPKERSGLAWPEFFNLALYAATPPILIGFLAQALKIQIPLFWWIYFGMYAAFFIGAFSQCRVIKESDKENDIDLDL